MIIESKINTVTVFKDRAQIERVAVKELDSGEHTLIFSGLPNGLDTNSLQVAGGKNCILQDMKVKEIYLEEVSDEKKKSTLLEIEELEYLIQEIEDRINNTNLEKEFLQNMVNIQADNPKKSFLTLLVPDKMQEMLKFYRHQLNSLDDLIRENKKEIKKLKKRHKVLTKELSIYNNQALKTEKQVELKIFVGEKSEVVLSINYMVYNAGWEPIYDLRLNSDKKKLSVSYNAIVRQQTGEKWNDVNVKLSTAQPQKSGVAPLISPWYVDIYTYEPSPASMSMNDMARSSGVKMKAMMKKEIKKDEEFDDMFEEPMEILEAEVETGATSVVFAIPGVNSIDDNYEEHKLGITAIELDAKLEYNSIPKINPYAYLTATSVNTSDYPLLAGKSNIFLDNSFVSHSKMTLVAPNEEFKTSLGIDEGIKIEHKLINKLSKDEGIFSKKSKVVYEYRIEIKNTKPIESLIKIKDQIPVAQHQDIKIDLIDPKIKENTEELKQDDTGIIEWKLVIPAAEKEQLGLKFSVEYPRDETLTGLV